jgi:hypothetical protein
MKSVTGVLFARRRIAVAVCARWKQQQQRHQIVSNAIETMKNDRLSAWRKGTTHRSNHRRNRNQLQLQPQHRHRHRRCRRRTTNPNIWRRRTCAICGRFVFVDGYKQLFQSYCVTKTIARLYIGSNDLIKHFLSAIDRWINLQRYSHQHIVRSIVVRRRTQSTSWLWGVDTIDNRAQSSQSATTSATTSSTSTSASTTASTSIATSTPSLSRHPSSHQPHLSATVAASSTSTSAARLIGATSSSRAVRKSVSPNADDDGDDAIFPIDITGLFISELFCYSQDITTLTSPLTNVFVHRQQTNKQNSDVAAWRSADCRL